MHFFAKIVIIEKDVIVITFAIFFQILPSLQSFCIYAAVGVFVTYLMQITLFIGCFTLDAKRIERKRNGILPCIVHETFTPKLPDPSNALSWRFINAVYSHVIFTTLGKIIIVLVTIAAMSVGIMGSLQLKQWFDPTWMLPKESYLSQYIAIMNQKFPNQGYDAFVIMGDDVDYPSELPKIISLTESLENISFIQEIDSWPINFMKFVSTYYNTGYLLSCTYLSTVCLKSGKNITIERVLKITLIHI